MAAPIRSTDEGTVWIDARVLQESIFGGGEVPETEQCRRYYGRDLTPGTIENVIRSADLGFMRDLTDLQYETIRIDGHLSSSIGRRFERLSAADWTVEPASGGGVEPERAQKRADEVRQQLDRVRNFEDAIIQLDYAHCFGRACIEKEWSFEPSEPLRWRIDSLNWIHPRRLSFGPERELRLRDDLWANAGFETKGVDLRSVPCKWMRFTPQIRNDYPEREGFGPSCLYWAFFKRFGWRERMILTEIFGRPWRIVQVQKGENAGEQQLDTAKATADKMSANATGVMPKGVELSVEQLHPDSGKTHRELTQDADDEMSKIILGQTRTQRAQAGALGSEGDRVAQDSEDLKVAADARRVSAIVTHDLCRDIVVLNHGPEEARYTPTFKLSVAPPPNRKEEIANAKVIVVDMGMALKKSELYDRIGYEEPGPDDEVVSVSKSGGGGGGMFGAPPSVEATVSGGESDSSPTPSVSSLIGGGEPAVAIAARQHAVATLMRRDTPDICCSRQPDTLHGTPETFIEKGVREGARETARWADRIASSVKGLDTAGAIFERMNRVADELPLATFARSVERRIVQSIMLGALDSEWERENEEDVKLEAFTSRVMMAAGSETTPRVDEQPFDRMVREFRNRNVLSKDDFEKLDAAAKRRSFTIARMAQQEMLVAAHAELTKQLESGRDALVTGEGPDLREFSTVVKERFESAGWTPANTSHVETIYRNNVMGAYGAGRKAEMFQPDVVAARPLGQWRAVKDDRGRKTHLAADEVVLPLSSPFWRRAWPPAGHNCRCRVVSRSEKWAERRSIPIGVEPTGLPDPGWDSSGVDSLLRV